MKPDLFANQPKYVIDTCSLIDLNRWYPPTIAEGAWQKIDQLLDSGVLVSVEEVLEELRVQEDAVFEWAKARKAAFLPLEADLQTAAKAVLKAHPTLIDHKKRRSSADPFVIGAARMLGAAVVTEESRAGPGERPKIPNVCVALNVDCITVVRMLEREGLRLVLPPGAD